MQRFTCPIALCAVLASSWFAAPAGAAAGEKAAKPEKWIQLFNGKDLSGWTPKIRGYAAGENYGNTFRVEDGVLKVVYDKDAYPTFDNRFGHLAYKTPFSKYRLRIEYRFVGEQVAGGPGWAFRNSGVMLHAQAPKTMEKDQEFPICVEVQFLGGKETGERSTANMCSPSTNIVMDGKLITEHCVNSTSKTFRGDQWVTVEIEVHGGGEIKHLVNGETVMTYSEPQLDERDALGAKWLKKTKKKLLTGGYLYLQAESHPLEFRKVELLNLAK